MIIVTIGVWFQKKKGGSAPHQVFQVRTHAKIRLPHFLCRPSSLI